MSTIDASFIRTNPKNSRTRLLENYLGIRIALNDVMVWNWAHIHIMLNHIPIIGVPIIAILLLVAFIRNDRSLSILAHWLLVAISAICTIVYLTGYGAHKELHELGLDHKIMLPHHEFSIWALASVLALGAWSIHYNYQLKRNHHQFNFKRMISISLIGALLTSILLSITANMGAKINHPEIREEGFPKSFP